MAQELNEYKVYVVIEFYKETHEFSEIEGVFKSREEAEGLTTDYNAKYFKYSYEIFEETLKLGSVELGEYRVYDDDELQKAADSAWSKVNAMYDELRHQKYKRCLAMAKWCKITAWFYGGAVSEVLNMDITNPLRQKVFRRLRHYKKWHKRWLELAEKFKEGT